MRKQKITTEDFVTKARKVHGDVYDYSNVEYKTGKARILIECPIHGKFFTTPYRHVVQKCGCQRCALKRVSNSNRSTTDKFIAEAKKVHGEKYDYERVKYVSSSNKVKITCKVHGEFSQLPTSHLRGDGCSRCGGSNTGTTLEFITKSKKLHGDIYDYSKVRYIRNKTKVRVGCKTHGSFLVSPNDHLNKKSGCPKCANGISKKEILFLNELKISESFRQYPIFGIGHVDGYSPTNNTVYEFLGDYWHGNLNVFDRNKLNLRVGKTFGYLNSYTFTRFDKLISRGYTVKYVWENEWDEWGKNKIGTIPITEHHAKN